MVPPKNNFFDVVLNNIRNAYSPEDNTFTEFINEFGPPVESSSQINTVNTGTLHRGLFVYHEVTPDNTHIPSITQRTKNISLNVDDAIRGNGYTIQGIACPIRSNSPVGNQSVVMQRIAESNFQAQSNLHQSPIMQRIAESNFQAQSNLHQINEIATQSSSQVQSNLHQMNEMGQFGSAKSIPKLSWVQELQDKQASNSRKSINPMLPSRLPWYEVQLSDISKLTRPHILGINFNFSSKDVEVVFQEYSQGKAFYVSHENIPNLTRSNFLQTIPDYYENNAHSKTKILVKTILIEDGVASNTVTRSIN
jgi:hypothetical protein